MSLNLSTSTRLSDATARALGGALLLTLSGPLTLVAAASPATTLLLRTTYALPVAVGLLVATRRSVLQRAALTRATRRAAIAAGIAMAANLGLWHVALSDIGLGPATIVSSAQVALAAIPGLTTTARLRVGGMVGLAVTALLWERLAADPVGAVAALGAAVAGAITLLAWERAAARAGSRDLVLAWAVGASLVTAAVAAAVDAPTVLAEVAGIDVRAHVALVALAAVVHVGAWRLLGAAVGTVGTVGAVSALLVGPAAALVVGAVVLAEPVEPVHVVAVGGMLVASLRTRSDD